VAQHRSRLLSGLRREYWGEVKVSNTARKSSRKHLSGFNSARGCEAVSLAQAYIQNATTLNALTPSNLRFPIHFLTTRLSLLPDTLFWFLSRSESGTFAILLTTPHPCLSPRGSTPVIPPMIPLLLVFPIPGQFDRPREA
jgi:hypothetical protein